MLISHIAERHVEGKRLGRHVHHDPASRGFSADAAALIVDVRHVRHVPIFDQGQLGSCTGNAMVGCLSSGEYTLQGTEELAVECYSLATHVDRIRGVYPPTDSGSSSLGAMRAAKKKGWIRSYAHAFGLDHVLRALVLRPGIVGINWREECDAPDSSGVVRFAGDIRGGHEVCMVGIEGRLVWFANSWGPSFARDGFFAMSWDDFDAALHEDGDAAFANA